MLSLAVGASDYVELQRIPSPIGIGGIFGSTVAMQDDLMLVSMGDSNSRSTFFVFIYYLEDGEWVS
eukprot:1454895-Prorocentrum_lima.AAC.1